MTRRHSWLATFLVPVAFLSVVGLTVARCGGGGGESSPFGALSGNYTGTIQDRVVGTATVQAMLAESHAVLSGTFQTTFVNPQNQTPVTVSGTVDGTVNGTAVLLTLTPSVPTVSPPSCIIMATLTQTSARQLTGTYDASPCAPDDAGGTIDLTRQ
jgi:hypothetical protein